jgi:hypothetical protein
MGSWWLSTLQTFLEQNKKWVEHRTTGERHEINCPSLASPNFLMQTITLQCWFEHYCEIKYKLQKKTQCWFAVFLTALRIMNYCNTNCPKSSTSSAFVHWAFCVSLWLDAIVDPVIPTLATRLLMNQSSCTGEHVEIKWSVMTGTWTRPGSFEIGPNRCKNHKQSKHHSAFDEPVQLYWWTCRDKVISYDWDLNPGSFEIGPNRCKNHKQSKHHSAFDEPVGLHWWTCRDKVN